MGAHSIQGLPQGSNGKLGVQCCFDEVISFEAGSGVDMERLEPKVTRRSDTLTFYCESINIAKHVLIELIKLALVRKNSRKLLHLGYTKRSVDIGHPVVVPNFVVVKLKMVGHPSGCRKVLDVVRKLFIVGGDGSTAPGGDCLVAVETKDS